MSDLIAQGTNIDDRWRRQLPADQPVTLGRTTPQFRVPWDDRISREHVRLSLADGRLQVEKIAVAPNPVFYRGRPDDQFTLEPGEHFVIGKTTFTLAIEQAHVTLDVPHPFRQRSFSPEFLRQVHFRNADQRIDVLNRLPDVISSAGNQQDLLNRLSNILLAGIPAATTIGIVCQEPIDAPSSPTGRSENSADDESRAAEIKIIHWDRRDALTGDFQPSEKLIRQAFASDETVLHLWQPSQNASLEFTFDQENDWAFLCPLNSDATPGWGIYVTGSQTTTAAGSARDSDVEDLQGDVKFCELVGSMLKNLLLVKQLERQQASLRGFFSPVVLEALAGTNPEEVLAPQQISTSVLFCDLRGFVKTSEEMSDELFRLLQRVSQSLDVVTNKILLHSGVIGDFHGDSVMGFWGWPLKQGDTAIRALNAALEIRAEFHSRQSQQSDFQIGIGIATGVAVAGKIGTRDQVKVTAFGPVVNLASRLEGMNRLLKTAMLIDQATMEQVVKSQSASNFQIRRLGMFKPFGLNKETDVFQVLGESDALTSNEIDNFHLALNAFQSGNWKLAKQLLADLPANDSGRLFLIEFMSRSGDQPPSDWNGVVDLKSK